MNPRPRLRLRHHRASLWVAVLMILAAPVVSRHGVDASSMSALYLGPGNRIGTLKVEGLDGTPRTLLASRPTVVVFWATWSPSSIEALGDIVASARRSGIRWTVWPVNLEARSDPGWNPDHILEVAHEAGYNDTVWIDADLSVMTSLGIFCVPTVVVAGLGGTVEVIKHGWQSDIPESMTPYFAGLNSESNVANQTADESRCQSTLSDAQKILRRCQLSMITSNPDAISHGVQPWLSEALSALIVARDSCPHNAGPYVLSAMECWKTGMKQCVESSIPGAVWADSTDPWSWTILAARQLRTNEVDSALVNAEHAINLDSNSTVAWGILGEAGSRLGDTVTLSTALNRIAKLNKYSPVIPRLEADLNAYQGRYERAAELWRTVLEEALAR